MSLTATVVIRGIVASQPRVFDAKGVPGLSFRLASNRRILNRQTNLWSDSPTTWISVEAFRSLAANAERSLSKGEPVVVAGELTTQEWEKDGEKRSTLALRASLIGHDLNRGVSSFSRVSAESTGAAGTSPGLSGQTELSSGTDTASNGAVAAADSYSGFADGSFDEEDCVDEESADELGEVVADND